MNRFGMAVCLVALAMWGAAHAHDLITAELAEGYIGKAERWLEQSRADPDRAERAKARLRIGVMLDEIREFLNRDLAAHGEVQGLASNYLVAELKRVGTPLAYSKERHFFVANVKHYRAALEEGLGEALGKEARLRLLRGEFYDSFDVDPLQTKQTAEEIVKQLALAEDVVATVSREPDREEARFIAAIVCARAAKAMTQQEQRAALALKATAYMDAFQVDYPDSLRSAAIPVLKAGLEAFR